MAKLPQLPGAQVIRKLKRLGFVEDHGSGGHMILRHTETDVMVSVPCHGSRPVKKGTLHGILKQAGVTSEDFVNA